MPQRREVRRRKLLGRAAGLAGSFLGGGTLLALPPPARAQQGVELTSLRLQRADGLLTLEFSARVVLPRAVEEALTRGVPVYFLAQATLWRNRWYWRDERIARVSRQWRVAFQPLTGHWRVGLGGLNQNHATLAEALAAASSSAGWKLADLSQLDPDRSYTLEFEYRLDTSQLPSPMQFGLVTQGEWAVGVSRVMKLE
ncbi:MAG: DUF4390 domain-containing protein [Rubrivivax sp.]|nr:DUF4390 domain-containing protein [Rubrivivax sp.]